MAKKNPVVRNLEDLVRELERELEQTRRKLKRALKQLSKYEDIDIDSHLQPASIDIEVFSKKDTKEEDDKKEAESYITVTLPDGKIKKIKKRM